MRAEIEIAPVAAPMIERMVAKSRGVISAKRVHIPIINELREENLSW